MLLENCIRTGSLSILRNIGLITIIAAVVLALALINVLAQFKADIINSFIEERSISSVIEFGCGDGNQLKYYEIKDYLGFDVSPVVISHCNLLFKDDSKKSFKLVSEYAGEKAELAISMDVIYHLVEDDVFFNYMARLFESAYNYVIIYSSNSSNHENNDVSAHVRHREFSSWIDSNAQEFRQIGYIPNKYPFNGDGEVSSYADFYIYERILRGK